MKRRSMAMSLLLAVLALFGSSCLAVAQGAEELDNARGLLLRGRYAEAGEIFAAHSEEAPAAAVGLSHTEESVGQLEKAKATLEQAAEKFPDAASPRAELARLAYERGDYEDAAKWVAAALECDGDNALAHWILAQGHRVSGRLEEAAKVYRWFIDYYNANDISDPEVLRWVGLGAAQYARWNHLSDQFGFLVNDLFPDAVALEGNFWPAHYETGLLYLEKYNQREASRELKAALKINPQAAPVYSALARLALQNYNLDAATAAIDKALEINPQLAEAHFLRADVAAANFRIEEAIGFIETALKLNPRSEEALGRLAAAYMVHDRSTDPAGSRAGNIISEVTQNNPHAGLFFHTVATRLEERRKFTAAERYFREALQRLPRMIGPRAGMGLMFMRLGREEEAAKLLDESFEIDPFNVRVSNMLKVLEVLDEYETLETEHFIIKYDKQRDEILAQQAGRYMEEVYPQLCRQFAYEPAEKSLFELFNRSRNTRGHGWFSARMVGLPYVGTVGACAGTMVAMASPTDMKQKFNWARVLKHEFVHVINLQQTDFNIPHWFTEALAVLNEGYPRSGVWNQLLAERVPPRKLFNLDTIDLGFIRPNSSLDWQMAYCQAELYAQYMIKNHGEDSIGKLLATFAEGLPTPQAVEKALNVKVEDFEQGYLEHLDSVVAELSLTKKEAAMTFAALERAQQKDPTNPDLAARLAQAHLARRAYPTARKLARAALSIEPKHQLASYVVSRLHLLIGDTTEAIGVLEDCLDEEHPQENVLALLAGLRLKAKQYDEAARLYTLGAKNDPFASRWPKALAKVYLTSGDDDNLSVILTQLARMDGDDFTIRKKLAQLSIAAENWKDAEHWANQATHIDVMDAAVHGMLAQALARQDKLSASVAAYEIAVKIEPGSGSLRFALAEVLAKDGQTDKARTAIEALQKLDPDYPGAKDLLESLDP